MLYNKELCSYMPPDIPRSEMIEFTEHVLLVGEREM